MERFQGRGEREVQNRKDIYSVRGQKVMNLLPHFMGYWEEKYPYMLGETQNYWV